MGLSYNIDPRALQSCSLLLSWKKIILFRSNYIHVINIKCFCFKNFEKWNNLRTVYIPPTKISFIVNFHSHLHWNLYSQLPRSTRKQTYSKSNVKILKRPLQFHHIKFKPRVSLIRHDQTLRHCLTSKDPELLYYSKLEY